MPTLTGSIERIVYESEDQRFVVARMRVERAGTTPSWEALTTVVGSLIGVRPGQTLRVIGDFENHPRHGPHLRVLHWEERLPATADGIEKFLGSGAIKGIGRKTAERIVATFGEQTIEIIEKNPERLSEVPKLTHATAERLVEELAVHRDLAELMMFLRSHDLPGHLATRLRKQYGRDTVHIIRHDPYRLSNEVYGVGFRTADDVATKLGLSPTSDSRLMAGIRHVLEEASRDGHIYLPVTELFERAGKLLAIPGNLLEVALLTATGQGLLVVEDDRVYIPAYMRTESNIAQRLVAIQSAESFVFGADQEKLRGLAVADAVAALGVSLAENQLAAVRAALTEKVSIITGGPGTGKTMCLHTLITALDRASVPYSLCAPTGRAAKRMTAATGRDAQTIHRLLGYQPNQNQFGSNQLDPLEQQFVIVDEVSMLDVFLFNHLLEALPNEAHLVLVGDADQLPSVGPGNVLRDLLSSGVVPSVTLDELFRQSADSRITTAAHSVRRGELFDVSGEGDLFVIKTESPDRARTLIDEMVARRIPNRFGLDPLMDIQVLSPMNRGVAGVSSLNESLQQALNPNAGSSESIGYGATAFHQGDKVMQIRNNYDKEVFNGDIGVVEEVDSEAGRLTVRFAETMSEARIVRYEITDLHELTLAYAVSVHKSQGSEFPCVVLPILMAHYPLLQRNLLYTAITRAKQLCVLVCQMKALSVAIQAADVDTRFTTLAERLRGLQESTVADGDPGVTPSTPE